MRAALYARFSTDRQSETSADDQLRQCRIRAERDGLIVAAEYRDEAVSGSVPVGQRPGARQMLAERLKRSESEKASLLRERQTAPADLAGIAERYRALVAKLDEALGQDIPQSRAVLRDVLGTVRIEDRTDGVYAVMKRPAVALLAVAGVSGSGSGGRILDIETEVLLHAH